MRKYQNAFFQSYSVALRLGLSRGRQQQNARTPTTPTRLKVLTGNPGKRRLNAAEPQLEPAVLECPFELGALAKQEWDRLVGERAALRLLSNLDRAALAAYCHAYALWAEAVEGIQKHGAMVKSPNGYPIQSPYIAIANRQAEIMMRIASEFGFTPASRSRITTPSPAEPSLFDVLDERAEG